MTPDELWEKSEQSTMTPDELWENYADLQQDQGAGPCTWSMRYDQFLAALAENQNVQR